ncbi:MAG: YcnI family protein, partial [Sciscionella sp.]
MLTAAGVLALLAAAPASAHVHATADDAAQGGYAKITFRVPDEEENANTTTVQVSFPSRYPVASASTKPVPGWTAKVRTKKLDTPVKMADTTVTDAVSTITWTASAGGAIKPNEFQEFDVSAGPLPDNT